MTLKLTRTDFVEYSGRYDLVVDTIDYQDNGADKFIRSGQQWLSREFTIGAQYARWYNSLAIGDWYALVPSNRAIHEVWMSVDSEGRKWKLRKLELHELRDEAPKDPATITNGKALFWAPSTLRVVPEVIDTVTVDHFNTTQYTVASSNQWAYNGIIWTPPIDRVTELEVIGTFYHPELTLDADQNFWSERESHSLVMAACMMLEHSYRNFQGVRDWDAAIRQQLMGLELDLADQESIDVRGMEGGRLT